MKATPNDVAKRVLQIRDQLPIYEAYLKACLDRRDRHGVMDAAMDIWLLENESHVLQRFDGADI